jgi:hypothetical protein
MDDSLRNFLNTLFCLHYNSSCIHKSVQQPSYISMPDLLRVMEVLEVLITEPSSCGK